ncbi:MAG: FAD-dependent pyridine nucleotide-disulfide oxidoreductase, partial [Clostridiales bacterium]|nr:FAD-dependent pyridine nucleotide-disulfide oxidoreductase [Clostridiales bacterium]
MTDYFITSDSVNFETDVLQSSVPVVVYFYSDDCLPCLTFTPIFERTAAEFNGQLRFVKIFRAHNRQLAEKYAIKTSPAILFFRNGHEICSRLTGYISNPELQKSIETVIGRKCPEKSRNQVHCDVLIIGAGPAGLTAAIYSSRSKLYTIVLDSSLPGGQVSTTFHIANYPGTNGVVRGLDLMENMKTQALSFGTQIDDMQQINEVNLEGSE